MCRGEDATIGPVGQRPVVKSVLTGQHCEVGRAAAQQVKRLCGVRRTILDADDVCTVGELQHRLVAEVDAGAIRDVVDQDGSRRAVSQRREMAEQSLLRWSSIVGAGNQIAVDGP